jgi:perosamine synthetase
MLPFRPTHINVGPRGVEIVYHGIPDRIGAMFCASSQRRTMTNLDIPLYQPDLAGNEKRYVLECLDTNWISSKGRFVKEFEKHFAKYIGVKYAIAVSNGTVALHLALITLGIGPGDEVIVPTLTYIATVNSITYTGATPVFVDSVRDTWQIDPADVRRKITPRTKAIIAVHVYGHPCQMDELQKIASEQDVFLVEDCAEAFGAQFKGKMAGNFGDISCFSFFGNKTITTGEGGMVVSNDQTLAERAGHFKGQGLAADREYWHDVIGYNYRMTNICAAIGLAQLERANEFIVKKRELALAYQQQLKNVPIECQIEQKDCVHSFWMNSIVVKNPADRDPLRAHLRERGIETRPLFYPVHTMPMYSSRYQRHPIAEDLAWRGINIPSWPGLSAAQIKSVTSSIAGYFGKAP